MSTTTPARAAERAVDPVHAIQHVLNRYKPVIHNLLDGTGTNETTFLAWIANAMRATPKLWGCEPETVLGAALRCAQLALPPNDGNNLAWIIPYKTTATFQLGYGGVMELARRAEPGLIFDGFIVYPNDLFDVDYGRVDQPIKHRPAIARGARGMSDGGDPYAWWVRARHADGRTQVQVLNRNRVEYHRSFSKQPDGEMWSKSYDAAALKSCVLEMRRWLPASRLLSSAVSADEEVHDVRDMEQAGEITSTAAVDSERTPADNPDDVDETWIAEAKGETS